MAFAQNYPSRPVRLIVGFPPGGAADILGRIAAQQLTERLGQQVVVDNRGGAGGLVATEIAGRAAPDGYTLLFTSIPHVINPHLYKKVQYDAVKDFAPVAQFVNVPLMMAANPSLPAKTVKELITLVKSRPGQVNYASGGSGASSHLAMELFKSMAGIDINHIPYKGTGPLITDLIAGQVGLTIASAVPLAPQVKAGKLRALAVTGSKRSNWASVRSGAIFRNTGFVGILFSTESFLLSSCNPFSNSFKGPFSCNSRSPGVLGELTLTTK